jgi:acetate kinase
MSGPLLLTFNPGSSTIKIVNAGVIRAATSRVTVLVLSTDEEQVIANEVISILRARGATA